MFIGKKWEKKVLISFKTKISLPFLMKQENSGKIYDSLNQKNFGFYFPINLFIFP